VNRSAVAAVISAAVMYVVSVVATPRLAVHDS
jgi:hypothetical protein